MNTEFLTLKDVAGMEGQIQEIVDKYSKKELDDSNRTILNLYCELQREIDRFKLSSLDISLISLSVRNIFELYLILLEIKSGEESVQNWVCQIPKDLFDIQSGFASLMEKHGKNSEVILQSKIDLEAAIKTQNVKPSRLFAIKELSQKYGFEEDYNALYKLCSKMVHPSSVKLNLLETGVKEHGFHKILIHCGVVYISLFVRLELSA